MDNLERNPESLSPFDKVQDADLESFIPSHKKAGFGFLGVFIAGIAGATIYPYLLLKDQCGPKTFTPGQKKRCLLITGASYLGLITTALILSYGDLNNLSETIQIFAYGFSVSFPHGAPTAVIGYLTKQDALPKGDIIAKFIEKYIKHSKQSPEVQVKVKTNIDLAATVTVALPAEQQALTHQLIQALLKREEQDTKETTTKKQPLSTLSGAEKKQPELHFSPEEQATLEAGEAVVLGLNRRAAEYQREAEIQSREQYSRPSSPSRLSVPGSPHTSKRRLSFFN